MASVNRISIGNNGGFYAPWARDFVALCATKFEVSREYSELGARSAPSHALKARKNCRLNPFFAALIVAASAVPGGAYDEIRFLDPIKIEVPGRPVGVAASVERFFVLDGKKGLLQVLDAEGRLLRLSSGRDEEALSDPKDLALSPDGRVFVADTGNSRIKIFDADGKPLGFFGSKGSRPGQLSYPESVAVGADGRVYVADTGNHRVQVFTQDGIFLFGFGQKGKEPGEMKDPTRIAVDAGDFVYVLDSGNERLLKFGPDTRLAKTLPLLGQDFAVDEHGFIYSLDASAGKVKEQGPEGGTLGSLGSRGTGKGQFKAAAALALAPDGTILVLDPGNKRLQPVSLTNKLKVRSVEPNRASKLLVSGPVRSWNYKASVLAASGTESLYGWLPEEGQFFALDAQGKQWLRFGAKSGKDPSSTKECGGLAASERYGLYVADAKGDKLQHFSSSGTFIENVAASTGFFDSKKKEGRVRSPHAVAINEKGTVYVADTGNRRVDAFSPDGSFVFAIGPELGTYELQEPIGLAWDGAGFIYILDRKLKKVFKCEPSGGFVTAWGEEGLGAGQLKDPVSIAYDGFAYVYVLDQEARRVSVFGKDGAWVTDFFAGGEEERNLQRPTALAVQGDRLIISDPAKGKVLSFRLHPHLAPPVSISSSAVEGVVELRWRAHEDPWIAHYRISRASVASGPFEPVGVAEGKSFKDDGVEVYKTYYYRIAAESRTKDVGPPSLPIAVLVPGAFNRAPVEIASVEIGNMLPANYKYYLENAVGKAIIVNNVNVPFQNVKLSFRLKDFMDFATETVLPKLDAQSKAEIPLMATLNNHILEITEETPIQAEVSLTYYESGTPRTVSLAKPLRVYSRNAIIWDKPERINAFVTMNDTPVLEFQKKVRHEAAALPAGAEGLGEPLVDALRIWSALGALGVRFQQNPSNPFETVSQDPAFPVDYTQFPRETLKRKAGQCDDLVTLLASMLEGANVRTAVLDYPGHMALMFDTGEAEASAAGLPESDMVQYEGTWWIPLEATLLGSSFSDAHHQALSAYREMAAGGRAKIIDLRKAAATFEPVTMPPTDWSAEVPSAELVAKGVDPEARRYAKERYQFIKRHYEQQLQADSKNFEAMNHLGLLEVESGNAKGADAWFVKVLSSDPSNAAALNNQGGLAFLRGEWAQAEAKFQKAAAADPADPGVWLNLAKVAAKKGARAQVKEFGEKAVGLASEAEKARYRTAVKSLLQ